MPHQCLVSQFMGVSINMYWDENRGQIPHFVAVYYQDAAVFDITGHSVYQEYGYLPSRVKEIVIEWAYKHLKELLDNWERCLRSEMPLSIEGLE